MRLLNRLNQYQRLWQPSAGETQHVTVSELAERCFCSERHLRTLLRQAQQAGWLRWEAQSGRGKRGRLQFLVTPESLRTAMMEQALEKGQQLNVLELAQLAPGELRAMLQPLWAANGKTIRRHCVFPTIVRLIRCSRVFCRDARNSISQGKFFRVNALRPRQSISLRGFGASLGGFRRRFTLGFLYSLHAALA